MDDRGIQDNIEDLQGEEWREIEGYQGKYLISNYGRLKSLKYHQARLLKPEDNGQGYQRVALSNEGKVKRYLVSRLVAIAFVENDDPIVKNTVDHIDNQKCNNYYKNLRWLSLGDNIRAYFKKQNKE